MSRHLQSRQMARQHMLGIPGDNFKSLLTLLRHFFVETLATNWMIVVQLKYAKNQFKNMFSLPDSQQLLRQCK